MPAPYDVVGYIYRADLYCPNCTVYETAATLGLGSDLAPFDIESILNRFAARAGVERDDETTFDSGDFPKVAFRDQIESDDRCGSCGDLLDN